MAYKPVILVITILMVSITDHMVTCDTNSGTTTNCQGTECTYEELYTNSNTQWLQNLTSIIGSILHKQLKIHIVHDYRNCSHAEPGPLPSTSATKLARDCNDIAAQGHNTSGVYMVQPMIHRVAQGEVDDMQFQVYCDLENDGGGWTVFQRREDGSVGFFLGWEDYKQGFGYLESEFWLGLDRLHTLTTQAHYELLVNLEDANGNKAYARYDKFRIGDENASYKLLLGSYTGTAGDSLRYQANMMFSMKDRDNDIHSGNCAAVCKGGWWYKDCHATNLNGLYLEPGQVADNAMSWKTFTQNTHASLKATEMKIRPIQ